MTTPFSQSTYAVAQGTAFTNQFIFEIRDPTENDLKHTLYQGWVNTITKGIWYLESFTSENSRVTALWRAVGPIVTTTVAPTSANYQFPIGQSWVDTVLDDYWVLVNVVGTTATWVRLSAGTAGIDLLTGNSGGPVGPDSNGNINLLGDSGQIDVVGNPGTNTLTFSLTGGGTAIDEVKVDASTGPGTDPVLPTAAGRITVTGAQVATGVVGTNVIRSDSLAANTYTMEIQRTTAVAATDITKNGVSHFDSADFTVDANGFVSSVGGSGVQVVTQVFSSNGTYTPTTDMKYCIAEVVGGGAGGGGVNSGIGTSGGGGGGAGGYARETFTAATIGASQAVTIGAAGAGGAAGANPGAAGGTTTLGALLQATGGAGGAAGEAIPRNSTTSAGGIGGVGTLGDINTNGAPGGYAFGVSSGGTVASAGGAGGSSFFGGGAVSTSTTVTTLAGVAGTSAGGGGSGAAQAGGATGAGGAGFAGLIVVTEFVFA